MIEEQKQSVTLDSLAGMLESLSRAIRDDFAEVRASFADVRSGMAAMATKQDLADLRDEMIARFATHSELQSGLDKLRDELLEEIGKIKYAKEIDELRFRVDCVENKLGISHDLSPA